MHTITHTNTHTNTVRSRRPGRTSRRLLAVAIAAGAVLITASPADAAPPEIVRYEVAGGPDVFTDACGEGVDLVGYFTEDVTETTFFDADGVPIRFVVHSIFDGVITRTDTGRSVRDPGRVTFTVDLVTGEAVMTGLAYNITSAGDGEIFQVVGRSVFEPDVEGPVFKAGPGDFLIGLDPFEEVCAALA